MGVLVSFVLRICLIWMTWGLVKLNCSYLLNGELKKKKMQTFYIYNICQLVYDKSQEKGCYICHQIPIPIVYPCVDCMGTPERRKQLGVQSCIYYLAQMRGERVKGKPTPNQLNCWLNVLGLVFNKRNWSSKMQTGQKTQQKRYLPAALLYWDHTCPNGLCLWWFCLFAPLSLAVLGGSVLKTCNSKAHGSDTWSLQANTALEWSPPCQSTLMYIHPAIPSGFPFIVHTCKLFLCWFLLIYKSCYGVSRSQAGRP